jgi:diadenosine tetraphosphate (Ap4A) HIT family hydrolase
MCTRQFYREIVETPRFYVVHNEFPLVEGHLLIISKEHKGSTGCLTDSALVELNIIKTRVAQVLRDLYGSAAFYENGRRTCCIARNEDRHITNHFHLNALPFPGDISEQLRSSDHKEVVTHNLFSLRGNKGVYYYFEGNDGRCFFYDLSQRPAEHNMLRRLISAQLGKPEIAGWDNNTQLFSQTEMGVEALTRLRKALRPDCR